MAAGDKSPRRFFIILAAACFVMCQSVILMHMHYNKVHSKTSAEHASEFDSIISHLLLRPNESPAENPGTNGAVEPIDSSSEQKEPRTQKEEEPKTQKEEQPTPMLECVTKVPKSSNIMMDESLANDKNDDITCTSHNSEAWLKGPRFGNARDPLMTPEVVQRLILDLPTMLHKNANNPAGKSKAQSLLGNTLCYEKSRFLNDSESSVDDKSVRLWAVRLTYLALHYHQHRLAVPEARARYKNGADCPGELLSSQNVGNFDYECGSDAKYLVVSLAGNGIGSNVRGGTVVAMVDALAMDRVVVFTNNAPYVKGGALQHPWALASCERKDYQCFFQPSTPCVLTHDDLQGSYQMTRPEVRVFRKRGELPKGHEDDKVIRIELNFLPQLNVPLVVRERLSTYAHALLDTLPCDDPRLPAMRKGADQIMVEGEKREGYNYAAAAQKIQHAMAFYFLRPNLENMKKIDEILNEIIPDDFDPENSVGLPIRGKCRQGVE
jgi:hypothetical protein